MRTAGLLRLPGAFSPAAAEEMRERLWEFLADRHAIDRADATTWSVAATLFTRPHPIAPADHG